MDGQAVAAQAAPARIALVSVSSQYVHSALAPWCLKAGLAAYAQRPHEASVLEGTVNEGPERLLAEIISARPDMVGLSCYIWNITWIGGLLPLLRRALPGCVIVLGGPEVSHRSEDALARFPEADYVLSGEGELPFARLADALGGLMELDAVPGLCRRLGAGFVISPPFQHEEMQPSPYGAEYLAALRGRIAYLETSRGCPYACAFCLSGQGETLRQAPMARVREEILLLAASGARTVKLVDRTFNADRARAREILAFIISEHGKGIPLGITFHFEIAGDLLDEPTLTLIEQAPKGLFQFEIGLQSMDESTLRLVRRRTDMAHLGRQVQRLIGCGTAHVHLDLIAGLPGEDLAGFIRGFNAAYRLRPHALQLGFLKLLHGSAMREEKEEYPCEYDPEPPYQVRSTPWLRETDLETLRTAERALDKLHNAGRFARTLLYLTGTGADEAGIPPFELFFRLGGVLRAAEGNMGSLSLDRLTDLVFEHLAAWLPERAGLLRDLLLTDRLASTPTTVLPPSLKRGDARYYQVKRALEKQCPRPAGIARAIGFLYAGAEDQVIWCDYTEKDPVTGLYRLMELPVRDLLGTR